MQDLLLQSWAPKAQVNHNSYIRQWLKYCSTERILDLYMVSYNQAMPLLSDMFYEEKGKYGTIAVARSALSAVLPKTNGQTFRKDNRVSRMINAKFKLRPNLPKYIVTYDLNIRPQYMNSLPPNNHGSFHEPWKLCTLLYLLSGQRSQTISLKVDRSVLSHGTSTFYINTIQKTTRPARHEPPLFFSWETCLKENRSRTDLFKGKL